MYRTFLPLVLALSGLLLGGCKEAPPLPPRSQATSTPEESTTQGPGNWEAGFTKAELDAYEVVRGRWIDYQQASQPFFRDGKANADSMELFEEYFYEPEVMQTQLEGFEKDKIKAIGEAQVLWSRASRIDLAAKPPVVVIEECINVARTSISINGANFPSKLRYPVLQTIIFSRDGQRPWQVFGFKGPSTKDIVPCEQ